MTSMPPELKGRKVSEVFLEYAEPYLQCFIQGNPNQPTLEEIEKVLVTPWCVWNAIVLKNFPEHRIDYWSMLVQQLKGKANGMIALVESMKERKIKLFHEYEYLLGNFKLYFHNNSQEVRLSMEARDPASIPDQ